jgi:serine protease AprX
LFRNGSEKQLEPRSALLRGPGGRLAAIASAIAVVAVLLPAAAGAGNDKGTVAYVPDTLLDAANANPDGLFNVIVQGRSGERSGEVASAVSTELEQHPGKAKGLRRQFSSISGVAAQLTGKQIAKLAVRKNILAITEDAAVKLDGYSSKQQWPFVSGAAKYWGAATSSSLQAPTIAVVDSGIQSGRTDFGGRVVAEVNLTSLLPNSPGDGRGHGTFVAGIAAGGAQGYTGAAPNAKIVSLDVMDDQGMAMTRDVIAAADWIYQNKVAYGIRVANFSLHSANRSSFLLDPLDKAVEKLWFSGVVVVAASGNYAAGGQASGVPFAPGNDPFVITVGAVDVDNSVGAKDDYNAPWSAFGYTLDGFAKPELGAPGRYLIGPVPPTATLPLERPDRVTAPGYLQLSGTSFAAPVVAGAAALILARHPSWTPNQVKGALMLTAKPTPSAQPASTGVGEVNIAKAVDLTTAPSANSALSAFLATDPAGGNTPVFDAASWSDAAKASASWSDASWSDASWADASWATASWADASWSDASWASASWSDASWADASWSDASWSDASWASNAEDDALAGGSYFLDPTQELIAETELGIIINADGSVGSPVSAPSTTTTSLLP